jgi:hypothetical protein
MSEEKVCTLVLLVVVATAILRWRSRLSIGFQVLFLARSQIFLIASPLLIAGLSYLVPEVFGNLVILDPHRSGLESFYVAWIGFASGWMALAMTTIVLDHSRDRFGINFSTPGWFWSWSGLLFMLPPLILVARVYAASTYRGLLGFIIGCFAALMTVTLVDLVFHWLDPSPDRVGRSVRRYAFAGSDYPRMVINANPMGDLTKLIVRPLGWLGPGYLRPAQGPSAPADPAIVGLPYPEHLAAAVAVAIGAVFWAISFYSGWWRLSHGKGTTGIPTLAYLELLILLITFFVSGAAFFLDRYRIPVLAALMAYLVLCSSVFDTDHYVLVNSSPLAGSSTVAETSPTTASLSTTQVTAVGRITPPGTFSDGIAEWLDKYSKPNSGDILRIDNLPVVVVVCASGGGIEAAAWIDIVLRGLQIEFHERFTRSIRLISSTSGGSVGALFFIQSYLKSGDAPTKERWDSIVSASEAPALDATGWGFAHPDFLRLMVPWLGFIWPGVAPGADPVEVDRGWAIEQAWRVALSPSDPKASINSLLSDWRKAVGDKVILLPGTVFNATIVESGNPLLLSSISIPLLNPKKSSVKVFGQNIDPGADIANVTAARLSATFPYVSPVTRGLYTNATNTIPPFNNDHVADGGYYDNYGFTASAGWINYVIHNPLYAKKIAKIIVIATDSFPEEDAPIAATVVGLPKGRRGWLDPNSGWGSELLGPIKAALNARGAAQLGHDSIEAQLMENLDYLDSGPSVKLSGGSARSFPCPHFVTVVPMVALDYSKARAPKRVRPLSWQFSPDELNAIEADWLDSHVQESVKLLHACLDQPGR